MDSDQLIRLATIAVSRRFIDDPAFDREDLMQVAIVALLEKPDAHSGRRVMHARSALRNLRESNQCKRRRDQEALDRGYETPSREPDHVEAVMQSEIRQRLADGVGLSCKQSQLVVDTFAGLSAVAIAAKRGWKPSSVRRWLAEIARQVS